MRCSKAPTLRERLKFVGTVNSMCFEGHGRTLDRHVPLSECEQFELEFWDSPFEEEKPSRDDAIQQLREKAIIMGDEKVSQETTTSMNWKPSLPQSSSRPIKYSSTYNGESCLEAISTVTDVLRIVRCPIYTGYCSHSLDGLVYIVR
ncbi:hypothetical protein Q1695_006187 [Nippostrongylus brasiliensis]|nr:hypothetical protein Q1695_006187 [Nippostrongylus brasiliensis]